MEYVEVDNYKVILLHYTEWCKNWYGCARKASNALSKQVFDLDSRENVGAKILSKTLSAGGT